MGVCVCRRPQAGAGAGYPGREGQAPFTPPSAQPHVGAPKMASEAWRRVSRGPCDAWEPAGGAGATSEPRWPLRGARVHAPSWRAGGQ